MPTNTTNRNAEIRTKSGKRIGTFRSLEDAQQYIADNNLEQVFQEPELAGITVTTHRPRSFREHLAEGAANFEETFGLTPKDAAGFIPIVGDAIDLTDIGTDLYKGNYTNAAIGAGLFLLPNIIEKPAKALYRGIKSAAKRAYTTPTKMLGNRSLRSNLKVFTGHRVRGMDRYTNFDKGIRDRLESAYPDYMFDIQNDYIKATEKNNHQYNQLHEFSFTNPITNTTYNGNQKGLVRENNSYIGRVDLEHPTVRPVNTITKHLTNKGTSLQEPISEYEHTINNLIGDNARIAGSTPIYGKGYALGTPNDLELVSTEHRFPNVVQALGGQNITRHGDFGYDMSSRYGINNNPVTTHIINENANGRAVGPIAHEYYSLLYPEEYRKLTEAAIDEGFAKGKRITLDDIELPISAEELYSSITPDVQERKLLKDLFISDKDKHVDRAFQILTSDNKVIRDKAVQSMREAIGHHFGKDYKLASETYPNITFNNIEANERFLESIGLPTEYAKDPDIMRNIVDRWHIAETTQSRNTFISKEGKVYLPDRPTMERAARSIYAPYNGNTSGIGGNTIINSGIGGLGGDFGHIMQQRLTFYPEKINTPLDLINQENRLAHINSSIYNAFDDTENAIRLGKLSEAQGIAKHRSLAEEHDIPAYYGSPYYGSYSIYNDRYVGNLVEPVDVRTYPISGGGRGIHPEVGGRGIPKGLTFDTSDVSPWDIIKPDNVDWMGTPLTTDLLKETINTGRIYNDWNAWFNKTKKANRKLNAAKERAKYITVGTGITALGVGTFGGVDYINKKSNEKYIAKTKERIKSMSDEDLNYILKDGDKYYNTEYIELLKQEQQRRIANNTKRYGGRITLSSDY